MLAACRLKNLQVCGAYTHLCAADSPVQEDIEFTLRQARGVLCAGPISWKGRNRIAETPPASSAGCSLPRAAGDYVRAGIALYGCLSRYGGAHRRVNIPMKRKAAHFTPVNLRVR